MFWVHFHEFYAIYIAVSICIILRLIFSNAINISLVFLRSWISMIYMTIIINSKEIIREIILNELWKWSTFTCLNQVSGFYSLFSIKIKCHRMIDYSFEEIEGRERFYKINPYFLSNRDYTGFYREQKGK